MRSIKARNDDQFNFGATTSNPSGDGKDYGPNDWNKVTCDNLETCLGFPDDWKAASDYVSFKPTTNKCISCPETGNSCGSHHQSPIDLKRNRAIPNDTFTKECPDWHWMRYEDGTCTWTDVTNNKRGAKNSNNFHIRRHALQIDTPITSSGDLACAPDSTGTPRFPKSDYSKGFPDWFFLDHTDIIVPSAHTQEGKRYDAEVQLAAFYEVDDIVKNKIGTIALFLEGVEGQKNFDFLDKLICQWREVEDKTREDCGLPSVVAYPGCRNPVRGQTAPRPTTQRTPRPSPKPNSVSQARPSLRPGTAMPTTRRGVSASPTKLYIPFLDFIGGRKLDTNGSYHEAREEEAITSEAIHDNRASIVISEGEQAQEPRDEKEEENTATVNEPRRLLESQRSADVRQVDGEENHAFYETDPTIQEQEAYIASIAEFRRREAMSETERNHRHLVNFDQVPYKAYEWLRAVKTEYYFRYEGTTTSPPCSDTIHWRIMKDALRVNPMQIKELGRLLASRIAPKGSKFKECKADTAGKVRDEDTVSLNRPIQSTSRLHRMVFCECQDWKSQFKEDQEWCERGQRKWYDSPYGYSTSGTTGF